MHFFVEFFFWFELRCSLHLNFRNHPFLYTFFSWIQGLQNQSELGSILISKFPMGSNTQNFSCKIQFVFNNSGWRVTSGRQRALMNRKRRKIADAGGRSDSVVVAVQTRLRVHQWSPSVSMNPIHLLSSETHMVFLQILKCSMFLIWTWVFCSLNFVVL